MKRYSPNTCTRQTGSALIISLSILLVLTILGVSALSTSSLEEKMAGNTRDAHVAFEVAEEALRSAEAYLESIATTGDFNDTGTSGLFTEKDSNPEAWSVEANWSSAATATTNADVARAPQFIIQLLDAKAGQIIDPNMDVNSYNSTSGIGDVTIFQITARGYGVSPNSRVMLQTYYSRLF